MFSSSDISALLIRMGLFTLLFTTYNIINHFQRTLLMNLIWEQEEVDQKTFTMLNFIISFVPLIFACVYPQVGTILGFFCSISGFVIIYLIPVVCHLKRLQLQMQMPDLARALHQGEFTVKVEGEQITEDIHEDKDNS